MACAYARKDLFGLSLRFVLVVVMRHHPCDAFLQSTAFWILAKLRVHEQARPFGFGCNSLPYYVINSQFFLPFWFRTARRSARASVFESLTLATPDNIGRLCRFSGPLATSSSCSGSGRSAMSEAVETETLPDVTAFWRGAEPFSVTLRAVLTERSETLSCCAA